MKKLLLLRHAKSAWNHDVSDKERPLEEKGIVAIGAVAKHWSHLFSSYDVLLTSPANRAMHTANVVAEICAFNVQNTRVLPALYTFSGEELLSIIRQLDNKWEKVILVGHNPAFSTVADSLSRVPVPEIKTAGWVEMIFSVDQWAEANEATVQWGSKKEAINNK